MWVWFGFDSGESSEKNVEDALDTEDNESAASMSDEEDDGGDILKNFVIT
jgi:hypothetical protein